MAPKLANVTNFSLGFVDMTSSIFWGIWPYDLPHRRFYSQTTPKTFQYMYEEWNLAATVKYLKKQSTHFSKYLKYAKATISYN
jgi:hypothetical protein